MASKIELGIRERIEMDDGTKS